MFKFSIRTKLIAVVLLVILGFGAAATAAVFWSVRYQFTQLKLSGFQDSTEAHLHEINIVFDSSQQFVNAIANQKEVQQFLMDSQSGNEDEDEAASILKADYLDNFNVNNNYAAIYLMNKEGVAVLSTDRSFLNQNYGYRDYFQQALNGNPYIDINVGSTSGELGYYFSYPVFAPSNEVIGVVVAKLKTEVINNYLDDHQVEAEEEHFYLIDQNGVVIGSTKEEHILKLLGQPSLQLTEEVLSERYATDKLDYLDYDEVLNDLPTVTKPESYILHDEIDQERELLVMAPLGMTNFYFMGETYLDSASQVAQQTALPVAGLVAAAVGLAVLLVVFIVSQLLNPLDELKAAADDISSGNLERRAEISSQDEFKDLGEAFNKMANQLIKAKKEVEQKIEERTKELKKMNNLMVDREMKMIELKKEVEQRED